MIKFSSPIDLSEIHKKSSVLLEAFPYLKKFSDRKVVIKVGGELLLEEESTKRLAKDLVILKSLGLDIVVVHGGGPQVSTVMSELGASPVFKDGLRVTDEKTLEITSMVLLGQVNRKLVSLINSFGSLAISLSGIDANILMVKPTDPALGFVGSIELVSSAPINLLIKNGFIPVICSLGSDGKGSTYNINADLVAGEIAKTLKAEKLVLLTNVSGLYLDFSDKNSLISEIDSATLRQIRDSGKLQGGMIPKVDSILTALDGGLTTAHVLDGRIPNALLLEIFTREGIGTMIYQ